MYSNTALSVVMHCCVDAIMVTAEIHSGNHRDPQVDPSLHLCCSWPSWIVYF